MSLDVRILKADGSEVEPILSLRDDGYYCWLHPWFAALAKETGLYIDLYGGRLSGRGPEPAGQHASRGTWAVGGAAGALGDRYRGKHQPGRLVGGPPRWSAG